tara:strand:+ start:1583 stop:2419 length:837 start_codon:yes stop_codon:yes gene_type:complete
LSDTKADVTALTKRDCDITDINKVRDIISSKFFDCIINASAYTQVDDAECNQEIANLVNESAVANICNLLKDTKTLFVHFSTDYVFDGASEVGYKENDNPKPINTYGLSKLNGEKAIVQSCTNYLIFRTSWVYSAYGSNFPKTILENYKQHKALKVVDDQYGVPNHVEFICDSVFICINKFLGMSDTQKQEVSGIYHISCTGQTSWYHFSKYLLEEYREKYNDKRDYALEAIKSHEIQLKAKRPNYSVLNCDKIVKQFDIVLAPWQHYVDKFLTQTHE